LQALEKKTRASPVSEVRIARKGKKSQKKTSQKKVRGGGGWTCFKDLTFANGGVGLTEKKTVAKGKEQGGEENLSVFDLHQAVSRQGKNAEISHQKKKDMKGNCRRDHFLRKNPSPPTASTRKRIFRVEELGGRRPLPKTLEGQKILERNEGGGFSEMVLLSELRKAATERERGEISEGEKII